MVQFGALDSSQVLGFVLFDLALIVAAASLFGWLARRLGQPTVVGQIVAGVVLGPTFFGATTLVWASPPGFVHCDSALDGTTAIPSIVTCLFPPPARGVLAVLGQLGLALYMFQVGAQLEHRLLEGRTRGIATVSTGAVVIPVVVGLVIAPLLYVEDLIGPSVPSPLGFGLMVGALLSVTAFPVMAYILQEKRLDMTPLGSVGIAAAAAVTVLMFLCVATAKSVASGAGAGGIVVKWSVTIVFVVAMATVVRRALTPLGDRIERQGTLDVTSLTVLFILCFVASLVSERIGLTVIPGAFVAGAVLPARGIVASELAAKLRDVTLVVLLPVFLAFSGLNTDFTTVGIAVLPMIGLFLVAGIAAKWGGAAVSARLGGLSWGEGNVLGVLFNCRGLLPLVAALIALDAGVISPAMQTGAVLMALITTAMTGPLVDRLAPGVPGTTPTDETGRVELERPPADAPAEVVA